MADIQQYNVHVQYIAYHYNVIILFCNLILFCQTSYESGIKELSAEFRVRLQEELTQREAVEKQLEKQV